MKTAIAALIISLVSMTVTLILGIKNYRKSKRLEFFQRRDRLFTTIGELSSKNSEAYLISAQHEVMLQNHRQREFDADLAEAAQDLLDSFEDFLRTHDARVKRQEEEIKKLYSMCNSLNPNTDANQVETLLATVQVASKDLEKKNRDLIASLHTLNGLASIGKDLDAKLDQNRRALDKVKRELKEKETSLITLS